jgi:hypothetical protein
VSPRASLDVFGEEKNLLPLPGFKIRTLKTVDWSQCKPVCYEDYPKAAMEVLLGLLPLHVTIEAETQAGIYRLMCNQQWSPRSTNYGHARKSWDMEQEDTLLMGTDRMTPRCVSHKPFKVHLSNKHEWQIRFNPDNKRGLVWYTDGS